VSFHPESHGKLTFRPWKNEGPLLRRSVLLHLVSTLQQTGLTLLSSCESDLHFFPLTSKIHSRSYWFLPLLLPALVHFQAPLFSLKVEAVRSPGTLVPYCTTTRCHNPQPTTERNSTWSFIDDCVIRFERCFSASATNLFTNITEVWKGVLLYVVILTCLKDVNLHLLQIHPLVCRWRLTIGCRITERRIFLTYISLNIMNVLQVKVIPFVIFPYEPVRQA
jgi:hypothetical protein